MGFKHFARTGGGGRERWHNLKCGGLDPKVALAAVPIAGHRPYLLAIKPLLFNFIKSLPVRACDLLPIVVAKF